MTLTAAQCHVDAEIRIAETLPAAAFVDPEFLERELATVFQSTWQLVPDGGGDDPRPLAEQVASRGTRVPVSVLGRPVFLQRGWDDEELRAFPNTCTHAWYPLVLGASRGPTLVCAQHGRRFDCAGRFSSQPGFGSLPDFPRACDHLTALPVATWRQQIFVRLASAGASLETTLAEVEASLVAMPEPGPTSATAVREVAGNWKQHAWNFLDHFHIGFVHRAPGGLADAIELASYRTELYDHAVLQWVYAADPADGFDPSWLPARFAGPRGRRVFALWWFVFPNLALNFYPWGVSVNVFQPITGRPEATRFVWSHRAIDHAKHAERDRRWLSGQVDAEDIDTLAHVGRGIRSGFAPRGRFAPDDEQAAHWFHRNVARAVFG